MKRQQYLPLILIAALSLFVYACSDNGDPVGPGPTILTLSVGDVTVVEGDTALFVVSASGTPLDSADIMFSYSTVNGKAIGGTDFVSVVAANGAIANGSSSVTLKVVTIDNSIVDGTREFSLRISAIVGIAAGDTVGQGSITDDDAPPAVFVGDVNVLEGASADFLITLTKAANVDVILQYFTFDSTAIAGTDYTGLASTTDTIPTGSTSITVSVATTDNLIVDGSRIFGLVVLNVIGADLLDGIGIATITDDEVPMPVVRYSTQVKPMLSSRCAIAFCHGSGAFSGGFTMGAGAPYATVRNAVGFNGPIIVAGNAAASNLYLKTTSTPPFGSRMPLTGGLLSISEQNLIRDWINDGALDN